MDLVDKFKNLDTSLNNESEKELKEKIETAKSYNDELEKQLEIMKSENDELERYINSLKDGNVDSNY